MNFDRDVLDIDPAAETERLVSFLQDTVHHSMRRYGGVIGISGGVDSAVVLALCARAFRPGRIIPLILPEKESDPESERLARRVAERYGVTPVVEDITSALEGFGCYRRRDEAIARLFPEYDPGLGYRAKIVMAENVLDEDSLSIFYLVILTPEGEEKRVRLPVQEYLQIVAASNFKQRARMAMLYYYAELHNYAVIGTANKNEHDQGFFVKHGDGGVDIKPIAHLFKTQVYQLAEFLDVPDEIRRRTPVSDTYSAHSTQQEFFFRLPFETMDLLGYAQENGFSTQEVAQAMDLTDAQVQRAFRSSTRRQRGTEYLRMQPVGIQAAMGEREF